MAKASPAEQLRLLDLQALDAKLNQLRNRTRTVSENADIAALKAKLSDADSRLVTVNTEFADIERELAKSENDVEAVTVRIDRDNQRLNSGTGTSKDLSALQSELVSLARRRADLEEVELDVMERLDAVRARKAEHQSETDAIRAELLTLEEQRDAELAGIDAERSTVEARRQELAGSFEPTLLAVYEKTLAHRGVGAARLFHGKSEGSGMQLSPGDLAEIRRAAPDEIVFCPDSGCILVRSDEWNS